ncbi:helix-turn-helix domain-containing protein [Mucilaginibacter segetis]|uniref:Helix-turn-helix domain-containing protein n=1 Tax=Mucilaginibacter segetis TaxID=2793071 RepID=A0A934PR28_9SPHI|nr:helix-turn-helix domain-containing protein [Mucilaginibacter segetis]MBK0379203.1 helix-turn-helix domain-containing protein [Mucilaginibacter segetis]
MNDKTTRDQLLTIQDLMNFSEELLNDIRQFVSDHGKPTKQWIKSAAVKNLLRVSDGKLQYLRDKGVIPFTKLGGVTYYNLREIEELMNSDQIHAR